MKPPQLLDNTSKRIMITHVGVILVLLVNILFFTTSQASMIIQMLLIVAIWIHHKDDAHIRSLIKQKELLLHEDRSIFDRNVIVSEADLEGRITYVNKRFCDITGYAQEELIGRSHNILRPNNEPDEVYKELWNTIKSGETFHGIMRNIKKDGSCFWADSSITPIKIDGNTIGYKAIRFDVTDQVLAHQDLNSKERILHEQSTRFEFVINSSRDGFWDYNLETKEFYLNSGWKKRLGFNEEESITYIDYISLIPDEHRFEHHEAMHEILEQYDGKLEYVHFRIRYPLVTKRGERILIEDVGDAFFSPEHAPTRITGFHRDITEQERQNRIIESQNRAAAMGEMISNIAHQWRQPIAAINNTLNDVEIEIELEERESIAASEFTEIAGKLRGYTRYMSQTIDDFRRLSSNEKMRVEFFAHQVCDEAYEIVQSEYTKHAITFVCIELGEEHGILYGYKRELLQVFINILNNAKDILLERKVEHPSVKLSIKESAKEASFIFHDNAGGIPQEIMHKIFDPYFTTKHESVGTGIGLYMSKKIITQYFKGTLYVENDESGAKFTITIPREIL
ncbi:MAG: PAS domain S-box protein [Epsilonproteobacteria bacterium]|nr:PAS domain S-box protein [Campylobacterota bacterium]